MFDTDEGYVATGNYWFGRRTGIGVLSSTIPLVSSGTAPKADSRAKGREPT